VHKQCILQTAGVNQKVLRGNPDNLALTISIRPETPDFCGWLDESGDTFQVLKHNFNPETCTSPFFKYAESALFNRRGRGERQFFGLGKDRE